MVHITEPPDMTSAFNPRRKARNQTIIEVVLTSFRAKIMYTTVYLSFTI